MAVSLLDKIQHAIDIACRFPYSAADCKIFLVSDAQIRHMPVENYVLIYFIDEEAKSVDILRFCYTRMDLKALMRTDR